MRTTENEARQLICPRTIVERPADGVGCIGSRCMAWRWAKIMPNRYIIAMKRDATREPVRPANVPASWIWLACDMDRPAQWMEPDDDALYRSLGYCGLAGKPDHD